MADGDKDGELSGSYGVSQDQWPEGQLKNDRTGADMEWKALCGLPTDQERAALAVKCAEKIAEQEAADIVQGENWALVDILSHLKEGDS